MDFLFLKESLKFQNGLLSKFYKFLLKLLEQCTTNLISLTNYKSSLHTFDFKSVFFFLFFFKLIHYDDLFVVNFYYYFHPIYCFLHFYPLCSQQPFKQNSVHSQLHGDHRYFSLENSTVLHLIYLSVLKLSTFWSPNDHIMKLMILLIQK